MRRGHFAAAKVQNIAPLGVGRRLWWHRLPLTALVPPVDFVAVVIFDAGAVLMPCEGADDGGEHYWCHV